jgi:hypothetical protein
MVKSPAEYHRRVELVSRWAGRPGADGVNVHFAPAADQVRQSRQFAAQALTKVTTN